MKITHTMMRKCATDRLQFALSGSAQNVKHRQATRLISSPFDNDAFIFCNEQFQRESMITSDTNA